MLHADLIRSLVVADGPHRPPRPWSAASGLVRLHGAFCVVADDENALGVFSFDDPGPGQCIPLLDVELPREAPARKAAKADFESLAVLPPSEGLAHGALLAAGSGSTPQRQRAVWLPLGPQGLRSGAAGEARTVDLAPLYDGVRACLGPLNVEGLFVAGDSVCLLQRAQRAAPDNACVHYPLAAFVRWLVAGAAPPVPARIDRFALGAVDGVPLGFTDGAALPAGGWVFCAAAEDTADSYRDGACAGSAIGVVDATGRLASLQRLAGALKVEGIALACGSDTVWLVTDADDRQQPASLLRLPLSDIDPARGAGASPVPPRRPVGGALGAVALGMRLVARQREGVAGHQPAGLVAHRQPHLALHDERLDRERVGVRRHRGARVPAALGHFVETFGQAGRLVGGKGLGGHRRAPAALRCGMMPHRPLRSQAR